MLKKPVLSKKPTIVAISGGFDPVHVGHVRMIRQAAKLGDRLIIILNNDNWLRTKKGYVFMSEQERKEVLLGFAGVDRVVISSHKLNDPDRTVCRELRKIRPNIFANGGDRTKGNTPEDVVCAEIGCKMVFGVGKGGKVQSSSWLTGRLLEKDGKYGKSI